MLGSIRENSESAFLADMRRLRVGAAAAGPVEEVPQAGKFRKDHSEGLAAPDRDRREAQIVADRQARKDASSLRHVADAHARAPVRRRLGDRGALEPDLSGSRRQDAD